MDYGDLVVHLFDEDTRSYYELERLWADAPRLEVDQAVTEQLTVDQAAADA